MYQQQSPPQSFIPNKPTTLLDKLETNLQTKVTIQIHDAHIKAIAIFAIDVIMLK